MAVTAISFGSVPASANQGVTIVPSGPARIVADTSTPTGRILATFTINDPTLTATGATICRNYGDEKRQGCRYQRFDRAMTSSDDDYWDDEESWEYDDDDPYVRWDIVGQPGAWTVSYPIGFDTISREECLTAAWQEAPDFSASIEVLNDAGVVLATSALPYEVVCTGIEGGSTGPEETRVYAGSSVKSKAFTFVVVDTKHVLGSYRICEYSSITGRYSNCDREKLTSRHRTKQGWGLSYNLNYGGVGASLCSYIDRKWPQEGLRVEFYDAGMKKKLALFRGTRLTC